jgi:zinc transporter, ZIP family
VSALAAAMWGAAGAVALVIGAWIALRFRPASSFVGRVMGFGAGALLAAVAYELVPAPALQDGLTFTALATGALTFFALDRLVTRRQRPGADSANRSIAVGALLDGVPESLVLGMGLASGGRVSVAFLVAVFVSNLPEALGSSAGMRASGIAPRRIYTLWWAIVAASAVCAATGYGLLRLVPGADGWYVQAFAAGAVLTMLADSMIPEAYEEGGKLTGLLTVLGFAIAGGLSLLE